MDTFTAEDLSTIGGIATVSLLHSFIPTHWLPFSIVGRAQKWTLSRTLFVSMFPIFTISNSPVSNAAFSDIDGALDVFDESIIECILCVHCLIELELDNWEIMNDLRTYCCCDDVYHQR